VCGYGIRWRERKGERGKIFEGEIFLGGMWHEWEGIVPYSI
jgi:hypothetical protein